MMTAFFPLKKSACIGFCVFSTFFWLESHAAEKERVALVIANNKYSPEVGELANAVNDGKLLAKELHLLGFNVRTLEDADKMAMAEALDSFLGRLKAGSLGFFYFAGHGVEIDGVNYLLPVDAVAESPRRTKFSSISLSEVFEIFEESRVFPNVVVLDCCRNNPFAGGALSRNVAARGLGDVKEPTGTLVAFSTAAGKVAADADPENAENSPYTAALVEELRRRPASGLELTEVFRNTSRAVFERTGQDPLLKIPGSMGRLVLVRGTTPVDSSKSPAEEAPAPAVDLAMQEQVQDFLRAKEDLDRKMKEFDEMRQKMEDIAKEREAADQRVAEAEMVKEALAEAMKEAVAEAIGNGGRENPPLASRAVGSPWLFPDSSVRVLQDHEISGLSRDELWRARNEIFARKGFIFSTSRGKQFQNSLGGHYVPKSSNQTHIYSTLNSFEKANVKKIEAYE